MLNHVTLGQPLIVINVYYYSIAIISWGGGIGLKP